MLSRSFALLDKDDGDGARILWLRELFMCRDGQMTDIFGTIELFVNKATAKRRYIAGNPSGTAEEALVLSDSEPTTYVHPMEKTLELTWIGGLRECAREGGCIAHRRYVQKRTGGSIEQKRMTIQLQEGSKSIKENVELVLGVTHITGCPVQKSDNNNILHECEGPTKQNAARIVAWPHALIIDTSGHQKSIGNLDQSFTFACKQFELRAAMLHLGNHFTAIVRCPNGWMYYDGMWATPRFQFYPMDKHEEAIHNFIIECVSYEVCEIGSPSFGNAEFDWESAFKARGSFGRATKNQSTGQTSIPDMLKSLSQELDPPKKKRTKKEEVSPKTKKAPRIPNGWSFRRNQPTSGQKPTCRGCTFAIEYQDECIRYKHKPWDSSKWDEIH